MILNYLFIYFRKQYYKCLYLIPVQSNTLLTGLFKRYVIASFRRILHVTS